MSNNHHINFQITHKNKSDKTLKENNNSTLLVRRAINAICGIFSDSQLLVNTTFAIRYLKSEDNISSPVKTYFSVSRLHNNFSSEELESIQSNVETTLGNVYKISLCQLDWQQSLCTNAVSQIIKDEFFDLSNNLYAPKFLKASNAADFHQIINFMESKDSRTALEVCLQPYHSPTEKVRWMQAIEQMIQTIQSDGSSKSNFGHALADYQAYQKYYSRDTTLPSLFNYSIKAYGEKQSHVQALLNAFRDSAISQDNVVDCLVKSLTPQENALVKVSNTEDIERPEWQNIALVPIKKTVNAPKKGWEVLGNGSLNIDNLFATGIGLQQITSSNPQMQALPQGTNQPTSQGQLFPSQGGQITQNQAQTPITIADLKPLHKMVCLEEIQGFLNLRVSESITTTDFPHSFTIHDVINQFGHLITEDTYVAGIDRDGNPCISDFSKLAHRLVGGMNGTGKTNYILSVVYQFLHANPDREVFMIDFQAGLHYEYTIKKRKNVEMVTNFEDCDKLLKKMLEKHAERRTEMTTHKCRGRKELFDKIGIRQNAVLVIIDEAFYIKTLDRTDKKKIEDNLNILAAQARVTGIHILYSTQTPTSDVIDSQTLNNIGERVLLAIESPSDSRRIIGTDEAYELPLVPKGRALFRGLDRFPVQIATPLVPDEVW